MSSRGRIDSVYDFTDKALVELKAWLEPWFIDDNSRVEVTPGPTFPEAVTALAATRDLRGYWRLGEGASPFADTSGHTGGPANAVKHTLSGSVAMTEDITGALPAADDDGAVQFNSLSNSDYLRANEPGASNRFDFAITDGPTMTLAAWMMPKTGSLGYPGTTVGQWLHSTSFGDCGYRLGVNFPALTPFFQRRNTIGTDAVVTGVAMAVDTWFFVVGTYDPTNGHLLYVNGTLVDTDATTFTSLPTFGQGMFFALGNEGSGSTSHFLGGLDEVSVWGDALSADEIMTLYEAGVGPAPGAGTAWYHGSSTPSSGLGDDNSYYLDTATGDIWFKSSGSWSKIWDAP